MKFLSVSCCIARAFGTTGIGGRDDIAGRSACAFGTPPMELNGTLGAPPMELNGAFGTPPKGLNGTLGRLPQGLNGACEWFTPWIGALAWKGALVCGNDDTNC